MIDRTVQHCVHPVALAPHPILVVAKAEMR